MVGSTSFIRTQRVVSMVEGGRGGSIDRGNVSNCIERPPREVFRATWHRVKKLAARRYPPRRAVRLSLRVNRLSRDAHSRIRPAQFPFLLTDETDRSIDRSILQRASTFVPLGFVSTVSYGEERKKKEKGKKRGGGRRRRKRINEISVISAEKWINLEPGIFLFLSSLFSSRVIRLVRHVDAINRDSRLNWNFICRETNTRRFGPR